MIESFRTWIGPQLGVMPWERKAELILVAPITMPWWLFVSSFHFGEVPLLLFGPGLIVLFLGCLRVLLSRPAGWLDFSSSQILPTAFSRWWGDATKETARAWQVCLGLILIVVGALEIFAGGFAWLIVRFS